VAKEDVDWEGIERDYRAGLLSLREIADRYPGTNHVAISRRAKKYGWARDLTEKIKAKADDLVTRSDVTGDVTKTSAVSEREIVDSNAEALALVIRGQRKSLVRLDGVVQMLFDRLESELKNGELFSQLGEIMAAPDENGQDKLNDLYRKVIALPNQTDTAKKLAETLKTQIELERRVFKIDDQSAAASDHLREFMDYLNGSSSRLPVRG
jgi:hypothetical protein